MQNLDQVLSLNIVNLSLLSVNDIARTMLKHNDQTMYTGITSDKYKVACDRVDQLITKEIQDIELAMCFISTTTEADLIQAKNRFRFLRKSLKDSFFTA